MAANDNGDGSLYGDPKQQTQASPTDTTTSAAASGFGHPVYDQIGSLFQQYTGKAPTFQQVSQWGTNVDPQYMQKIGQAIYNTPDAVAYRQPKTPAATAPATPATPSTGNGQAATSPVTSTGGIPPPGFSPQPPLVQTAAQAPTGQAPQFQNVVQGAPADAVYNAGKLNVQPLQDQSGATSAQTALLMALLQHPESMTDQGVQQLKEQQKESALAMAKQQGLKLNQDFASRGVWGGGSQAAAQMAQDDATRGQMLDAYRSIDLQKMAQDQQDKLNVLGISDSTLTGQRNRDIAGGQYGLQGQMDQEQLNQAAAASHQSAWQTQSQLALQQALAQQSMGLDYAKLGETGREFDLGNQLDWQKMLDSGQNWRGNLGLGYANLDQASQIAMLHALGLG